MPFGMLALNSELSRKSAKPCPFQNTIDHLLGGHDAENRLRSTAAVADRAATTATAAARWPVLSL